MSRDNNSSKCWPEKIVPSSGTKQLDDTGKLDDLGPGPEHHGDTARLQSGEISRARHEIRG